MPESWRAECCLRASGGVAPRRPERSPTEATVAGRCDSSQPKRTRKQSPAAPNVALGHPAGLRQDARSGRRKAAVAGRRDPS